MIYHEHVILTRESRMNDLEFKYTKSTQLTITKLFFNSIRVPSNEIVAEAMWFA